MTEDRPTMGQDVYGFYTGQPTVGVMLWDGTDESSEALVADLVKFCDLRGASVVSAHARASIMGGMSPRIELMIQYPVDPGRGATIQDFTLQRFDALVLFSVHEKITHIQVIDEAAARNIIEADPPTIIIGVDPAGDSPAVVARQIGNRLRNLGS